VAAGEQGLLQRQSEIVQKSLTDLEKAYEAALACSLKMSLTTDDCTTLDQQSHEIEMLRSKLRKLISDLHKQEALFRASSPLG
jgi:hypothetical protein